MRLLICLSLFALMLSCHSQPVAQVPAKSRLVGGPCEICDAIEGYDYEALNAVDTLPDFERGQQPLKITGTIFQADGKTPAEGVILYIYHTDEKGEYQSRSRANEAGQYTYHQGWVKTDAAGHYTFYTFLPGAYPNGQEPRHIHPLIKEPDGKVYYIATYFFADDPLLEPKDLEAEDYRGGTGLLHLEEQGALLVGRRDITLGLNVPGYNE